MGVIYTPERFRSGQVPFGEDLSKAVRELQKLKPVAEDNGVEMVLVHGSVPEHRHTRRSDVDALIVYDDTAESRVLDKIRQGIAQISLETHAQVEATVIPGSWTQAMVDTYFADPLFVIYLQNVLSSVGPKVLKGRPDPRIMNIPNPGEQVCKQSLVSYFLEKFSKFDAALSARYTQGQLNYKVLQRAFELPRSTKRKLQQAFPNLANISEFDAFIEACLEAGYFEVNDGAALNLLRQRDSEYTDIVESAPLRGFPDWRLATKHEEFIAKNFDNALRLAFQTVGSIAVKLARKG
ncbi:hypothetical protein KC878_02885 [Candidatus Saccharibacteria bacterium]|nr:hypothetical protein [Candidatus Saccharibacteria bacterium]MCB9821321.1 hypothetical protein [Candidatus Nomurabacteria bacterium]